MSKNELNWMQKVGYVQSFIKQVEMELYSNGKCYNKLNFIFTEYGTDVNIPDIPEVPETWKIRKSFIYFGKKNA